MMTQVATDYCTCNIFEHVIHETWADEFTAFSTEKASNSEQTWHHILTFISTITLTPNFSTIISRLLNFHAKASEFANFTISMSTFISHCKVKKDGNTKKTMHCSVLNERWYHSWLLWTSPLHGTNKLPSSANISRAIHRKWIKISPDLWD